MFSLKTFKDSYDSSKNFYHVKVFGIKFRVATRTRGIKSNYIGQGQKVIGLVY